MPAKAAPIKLPVLSATATDAFDRYEDESEKQRAANARAEKAKKAKEREQKIIVGEMGDQKMAQLIDGRIIRRKPGERNMPAKPAHKQRWESLEQITL